MTYFQYNSLISSIHCELHRIAHLVLCMAKSQCADSANPLFLPLMARHKQLTDRSQALTDTMLRPSQTSN